MRHRVSEQKPIHDEQCTDEWCPVARILVTPQHRLAPCSKSHTRTAASGVYTASRLSRWLYARGELEESGGSLCPPLPHQQMARGGRTGQPGYVSTAERLVQR